MQYEAYLTQPSELADDLELTKLYTSRKLPGGAMKHSLMEHDNVTGTVLYLIVLIAVPVAIGSVSFRHGNGSSTKVEVGFEVHPDWRGRGVASIALELAMPAYEKHRNEICDFIAHVSEENRSSIQVLSKNGFRLIRRQELIKVLTFQR